MTKFAAVFIDEENIYKWLEKRNKSPELAINKYFNVHELIELLSTKGYVISKAVCYIAPKGLKKYVVQDMYELGFQVIPASRYDYTNENGRPDSKSLLDSMLIVDALATAYELKHISTFVIVSGDKDFYPLAIKLRELGKEVIFIGPQDESANILIKNFEFHDISRFINL